MFYALYMPSKYQDPYYYAQSILSYRDHSEFEMKTKMKRKKFSTTQINDTVQKLKKHSLIDDNNFCELFTEQTLNTKAVGPKWLAYRLKQKGIEQSIISRTLNEAFISGREQELAKKAASIWQRTHSSYADDRERLTRHLISRGFSYNALSSLGRESDDYL